MRVGATMLAFVFVLAACAGVESAGRNAERAPAPSPAPVVRPVPPPPPVAAAPAPTAVQPEAPVAAPNVSAPPAPPPARRTSGNEVVVPGQVERQVQPPAGDPRTVAQRMEDIRRWDTCVMEVQRQGEADPMRPQLDMPEDYCARALGQSDRLAVPVSRR